MKRSALKNKKEFKLRNYLKVFNVNLPKTHKLYDYTIKVDSRHIKSLKHFKSKINKENRYSLFCHTFNVSKRYIDLKQFQLLHNLKTNILINMSANLKF